MSGILVLIIRWISAFALYSFLGWALVFMYRELNRQGMNLTARRIPGINIMVRNTVTHQALLRYFTQAHITIGRDPGCDIPLQDDTISAQHAHLTYHHNQWWLEDLSSKNGTRLNHMRITTPTVITSGDEIQCGGAVLTISLSENVIIEPTVQSGKQPNNE